MFALTEGINIWYTKAKEPSVQPCKQKKLICFKFK